LPVEQVKMLKLAVQFFNFDSTHQLFSLYFLGFDVERVRCWLVKFI